MNNQEQPVLKPDYLFEVSWEVCNKVGGIHTVVGTKARTILEEYGDNYILIGPDFTGENTAFVEDNTLQPLWQKAAKRDGLKIRIGRWKDIVGNPIVVLVTFSDMIPLKDHILGELWESYKVDSIRGEWDYVEAVLFGYASYLVIKSFNDYIAPRKSKILAQFHEWMTASGGLFIKKELPHISTIFTTHATVMGRCIAGNGLPLYNELKNFDVEELATRFNVRAKYTIERAAAHNLDCFTTVSDLTSAECEYMLGKKADIVTPNGFEKDFVPQGEKYTEARQQARKSLLHVAQTTLDQKISQDAMIVCLSGRYEYKNKGIDEFIETLALLRDQGTLTRELLVYIMVPGWNHGPRKGLQSKLAGENPQYHYHIEQTTHYLGDPYGDSIVNQLNRTGLNNNSGMIKTVLVPSYLNGTDGIFNMGYYDLLIGMDLTVFPSYYEPWGYTPLESVAFGIPTITTNLAGFGLWVETHGSDQLEGVTVLQRDDYNNQEFRYALAQELLRYSNLSPKQWAEVSTQAQELSNIALWKNQFKYYQKAYTMSIETTTQEMAATHYDGGESHEQVNFLRQQLLSTSHPNWTRMMVERVMPDNLKPLDALSKNLWWCWNMDAIRLFESIDPKAWLGFERNPIALLDSLDLQRLNELGEDADFVSRMNAVYDNFCNYMSQKNTEQHPRIAYFSMEYGLHASLKIYSGGLGILAGDYIKEASDKNVPLTAVGLLYRYGYFTQRLSAQGEQEAGYEPQNFDKLPIWPLRNEEGEWVTTTVNFPGRKVIARVWRCDVGRTELYLLDTDHDQNLEEDRSITHHLYGGDWDNRMKQEFLLGIGGIRTLNTLGIKSDIYHCNEGHAAFIGLERILNFEDQYNMSFSEALEAVRSSSLFTTHTPVPAGHDAFDEGVIRQYMGHYPDRLKITWEQFINLGKTNPHDHGEKFSMSVLAANLSQEVNGVSWLHGEVSKDILGHMWPGYMPDELHIGYVTNGVHYPTWTASNLIALYSRNFGEAFGKSDYSKELWDKVHNISDQELWNERMVLKTRLIDFVKARVANPHDFKFDSPSQLVQVQEQLNPKTLTIGFARRFATYKRAHLLFTNLERLNAIVNHPERPVQFLFAGKAHPADKAGQDLIKRIVEVSKYPQFVGKIVFLQNYDMEVARRLVQGVDIWMNTPTRPLEASGTSGEKATMNGVMHFSVLDGWWVEGYKKGAGWMLPQERSFDDQRYQDELDAELVYSTIEDQIAPLYYDKEEGYDYSHGWMETVKSCIADVASNFTTNRMMQDYEDRFYNPLFERHTKMAEKNYEMARKIASWKRRISSQWDNVRLVDLRQYDIVKEAILLGRSYNLDAVVDIAGLNPEDIGVELVVVTNDKHGRKVIKNTQQYEFVSQEGSLAKYRLNSIPQTIGSFEIATRIYPKNSLLPHRMDMALVKWS